jgi:chromosome segregation ATPase
LSLANYNTAKDLFDGAVGNLEEQQNQLATLEMMYASDLQDYNTKRDQLINLQSVMTATREKLEQDTIALAELSSSNAGTAQQLSEMRASLDEQRAAYLQDYSEYAANVEKLKNDEARLATDRETIRLAALDIESQKSAQETQLANLEISEETIRNRELDIVSKEIEISQFESANSNTLSLLQARKAQLDDKEFELNSQVQTLRNQESDLLAGQQQYLLQSNLLASQISGLSIETESLNALKNELAGKFSDLQALSLEQTASAELLATTAENLAVAKVSYQASRDLLDAAILQYEKDLAAYELNKSALNQANLELSATNLNSSISQAKDDALGINDILKFIGNLLSALLAGLKAFMSIFGIFGDKGGVSFLTPPSTPGITQPPGVPPITVIGPGTGGTNWGDTISFPWLAFAILGLWGLNENSKPPKKK